MVLQTQINADGSTAEDIHPSVSALARAPVCPRLDFSSNLNLYASDRTIRCGTTHRRLYPLEGHFKNYWLSGSLSYVEQIRYPPLTL